MTTYVTTSGEMWDSISMAVYGTTDYTGQLMLYNPDFLEDNYIFESGVVLLIPDVETEDETLSMLPPWRLQDL